MTRILLALALLLIFNNMAIAESWVQLKGFSLAYDRDSIVRDGDMVRYWLSTTGTGEVQVVNPREMNCKMRLDRRLGGGFSVFKSGGKREHDSSYNGNYEQIAPGSDLEALRAEICPKAWEFWKRWL